MCLKELKLHSTMVPFLMRWLIYLSEGDRKAYYETSQFAMKMNRESVLKLRKENKELRKKLSDSLSVSNNWDVLLLVFCVCC